jgi:hypothetical protein
LHWLLFVAVLLHRRTDLAPDTDGGASLHEARPEDLTSPKVIPWTEVHPPVRNAKDWSYTSSYSAEHHAAYARLHLGDVLGNPLPAGYRAWLQDTTQAFALNRPPAISDSLAAIDTLEEAMEQGASFDKLIGNNAAHVDDAWQPADTLQSPLPNNAAGPSELDPGTEPSPCRGTEQEPQ